ncbi:MAG TPA: carbon monoxide dehydrogenase subunit G [Vicinamibacterales bacterium]|nr:carbon monoxide dehydrogenase subunit G [Vicinamibacterales bacterium]
MELAASYTFNAPPDQVWALLMNPDVLSSCIPGCERFERAGEDHYTVAMTVGLAAITGKYSGSVAVADKVEPTSYRLIVEGHGRAGFVNGSSAIRLRQEAETTVVDVNASVQVGGAIARVGQRLTGAAAKLMMDQFFSCLQSKAAGPGNQELKK